MKVYWFVSRHTPTPQQEALTSGQLIKVDDIDGFNKAAVEDLLVKADVEGIDGIIGAFP